jgi:hypothetical protein
MRRIAFDSKAVSSMNHSSWLPLDCPFHGSPKHARKLNPMMNVPSGTIARIEVVFDQYDFLRYRAGQNVGVQIQGW